MSTSVPVQDWQSEVVPHSLPGYNPRSAVRIRLRLPAWMKVMAAQLAGTASWLLQRAKSQQGRKTLRVCETASLGERRFVAVIQADGERFLIGGSATSVSLLAQLTRPETFASVLSQARVSGDAK